MSGIVLSAAFFYSIIFSYLIKDYFLQYSTILCAFWHMGFDLSSKLYYILFIILLILWNTSLYRVSQLQKIKSHQSCVWKSALNEPTNMVLLFFPLFHPWENADISVLHLSAGFSVAYRWGNVSVPLWILLVWKANKQPQTS